MGRGELAGSFPLNGCCALQRSILDADTASNCEPRRPRPASAYLSISPFPFLILTHVGGQVEKRVVCLAIDTDEVLLTAEACNGLS